MAPQEPNCGGSEETRGRQLSLEDGLQGVLASGWRVGRHGLSDKEAAASLPLDLRVLIVITIPLLMVGTFLH